MNDKGYLDEKLFINRRSKDKKTRDIDITGEQGRNESVPGLIRGEDSTLRNSKEGTTGVK